MHGLKQLVGTPTIVTILVHINDKLM